MTTYTVGMAVCWDDDRTDEGKVIHVTDTAVTVKWLDDGIIGVYKYSNPRISHLTPLKGSQDALTSVS